MVISTMTNGEKRHGRDLTVYQQCRYILPLVLQVRNQNKLELR